MWAAHAAKFGYIWAIGDGNKIIFWKDCWFGTFSLPIQFWEVYSVCNENRQTIAKVWDGQNLKITFGRNFSP
jgi:hypothetical protein